VAQVQIRAALDGLDKDMAKARNKIETSLSKTWQTIGTGVAKAAGVAIVGGVGAATAATAGLGIALGKLTMDALPLQGIRDSFHGIADDGDAMLAMLREGSLGMVRDIDLMASYNQAAQLVSKTFADQLPDAMGYLSKVAAATGQDMDYMMDSLVKGVGRLSPMILDNLGIQVQLSDATERAAEMFGVEEEALSKAQIQAGMMDVVLQKLAENTKDMPEVAGTAQQQWKAFGVTLQNFKDEIGLALIPVLQKVLEPLGELISTHGPALVELFETRLVPALETLGTAAAQVLGGDLAGGLETLFGPETAANIMGVVDTLQQVAAFISANLQPILAGLVAAVLVAVVPAFVSWATAAGAAAVATITAAAPVLAIIAAVGAAVALLVVAWQRDWGGIRTKLTEFWEGTARPILDRLRAWLEENIPKALQFLSDVWQNVLQPALEKVWAFVQADLVPLLEALAELVGAVLYKAGQALAGLWQNVLAPALETIWKWLGDTAKVIGEKLQPVLEWLRDKALPPIERALAAVSSAFSKVTDKVKSLADRIRSLKLPDWLTPGSPTPLEIGLRGIAAAMGDLSRLAVPRLQAELELLPAAGLERAIGSAPAQTHYHIEANYRYQDERSLREDIRLMQMLGAAT
jgi:hypothetical protein